MRYNGYQIRVVFKRFGKGVRGGFYVPIDESNEAKIEVKNNTRTRTQIMTLYHEYTHFVKELFKGEFFWGRLPEEEMCYAVEKAVIKVLEKYMKRG